jgi:hypothetical protein
VTDQPADDAATADPAATDLVPRAEVEAAREELEPEAFQAWIQIRALAPTPGLRHGLVNLNTAAGPVLAGLPGMTEAGARALEERRVELAAAVQRGEAGDGLLFRRWSEIAVDEAVMDGVQRVEERLARLRALAPAVALNSRAFLLVGQPRVAADSVQGMQQASRVEALVALDRGAAEYVTWKSTP